jgi:hypothetical protein
VLIHGTYECNLVHAARSSLVHQASPVLVVAVLIALLAIIHYFIPGSNHNISFWLMTLAYVVAALGTL